MMLSHGCSLSLDPRMKKAYEAGLTLHVGDKYSFGDERLCDIATAQPSRNSLAAPVKGGTIYSSYNE